MTRRLGDLRLRAGDVLLTEQRGFLALGRDAHGVELLDIDSAERAWREHMCFVPEPFEVLRAPR